MNKYMSIGDIHLVETDNSDEFYYGEIYALAAKNNSHKNPISEEVLRANGDSAIGKWIVTKIQYNDFTTHTTDESIIGVVPHNAKVRYERDEYGVLWLVVPCVLSKIYSPASWEIFKANNYKEVSCEFVCNEEEPDEYGDKPVTSFNIIGITVLGSGVHASCDGANIVIKQFSKDNADKYYLNLENPLKKFAEERRKNMSEKFVSHPIDTSKKSLDVGKWDGDKAKEDLIKEQDYETLAPKVCMVLEDEWRNREVTKLKYPVMCLKNGKWVYSKDGISSALAYAKQHDDTLVPKIEKLREKLEINDDEKGTNMKSKKFAIEGREAWGTIIHDVQDHEGNTDAYVDSIDDEKGFIIYTVDGVRYKVDADIKVGTDDKTVSADIKWDTKTKDDVQNVDGNKDVKTVEESKDVKKMSLDVSYDNGALLAMLENDTEENKKMALDLADSKDMNIIMSKLIELAREVDKYKVEKMANEKLSCIDDFNRCMATVKDKIPTEDYTKFYDEGKNIVKTDEIKKFSTKVKLFAFDNLIQKKDSNLYELKFACDGNNIPSANDDTDVFNRIAKE